MLKLNITTNKKVALVKIKILLLTLLMKINKGGHTDGGLLNCGYITKGSQRKNKTFTGVNMFRWGIHGYN